MAVGEELYSVNVTLMDIETPVIKIQWSRRTALRADLTIRSGDTDIITFTNLANPLGGETIIQLTSEQRSTILSAMSSVQELDAEFVLKTVSGSTVIGTSTQEAILRTSEENSAPVFTAFTFRDTTGANETYLGDTTKLIQNMSNVRITCSTPTARNGATLATYTTVIGAKTYTRRATSNTISFGQVDTSGDCVIEVTLTDSRGYQTTVTRAVTVIPYQPISFQSYKFRRVNYVEADTILIITGNYAPLTVDGVDKNALDGIDYMYREESSSTWVEGSLTGVSARNGSFNFSAQPWLSFDPTKSYELILSAFDTTGRATELQLRLGTASSLMSMREVGVGIFTNSPTRALDVNGNIAMHGYNVMGLVDDLDADLSTITEPGIYMRTASDGNPTQGYPASGVRGVLEVFGTPDYLVQRFTDCLTNTVYVRTRKIVDATSHAWMSWKQMI